MKDNNKDFFRALKEKSRWVRRETLKIHKVSPETRLASSLSAVEIFSVLYYGKILDYDPASISDEKRDRLVVSKGHGALSLCAILADLGFFPIKELERVSQIGAVLKGIPDPVIPGFETINGSVGHGLGVACGISLALKKKSRSEKVFVVLGDGELNEGSVWEAIMFAGEHKLDNLIAILDNNKICMMDFCRNIINLNPLKRKFEDFKWNVKTANGHEVKQLYNALCSLKKNAGGKPKILIADTVKGRGVACLENDSLCHVRILKGEVLDSAINKYECP